MYQRLIEMAVYTQMGKSFIVLVLIVFAVISDLKTRKIPNRLTVSFALIGLGFNAITEFPVGIVISFVGLIVGFLVFLGPYLMKAMGAGDVKLMAALGAITNWQTVLVIALCTALSGGIIVLVYRCVYGGVNRTLKRTGKLLLFYFYHLTYVLTSLPTMELRKEQNRIDVSDKENDFIPYAVAIALGSIITLFLTQTGWIQGLSI